MSGSDLAVLITAVTGAVSAIFFGVRNLRSDKTKGEIDKAAQLLSGYDGLLERVQAENERLHRLVDEERQEHHQQTVELRAYYEGEVSQRDQKIEEMSEQIEILKVTRRPL